MRKVTYERGGIAVRAGEPTEVALPAQNLRCRLTGLHFDTNKTFLLPGAIRGMRLLKTLYAGRPRLALLVDGHTDRAGSTSYNLPLSEERALSIAAFLRDDVDFWLQYYTGRPGSAKWGATEDATMLGRLGFASAGDYQDARGLSATGSADAATRRQLVQDYMAEDGSPLPADAVLVTHGCGEFHPEVPTADGVAEPRNRRVEIFLFEGAVDPPPQAHCPEPGCDEYARWTAAVARTIDLDQDPAELAVRVHDGDQNAVAGASVRVASTFVSQRATTPEGGQGSLAGIVRFTDLLPGRYTLSVERDGFSEETRQVTLAAGALPLLAASSPPPATDDGTARSGGTRSSLVESGNGDAAPAKAKPDADAGAGDSPQPLPAIPGVVDVKLDRSPPTIKSFLATSPPAKKLNASKKSPPPPAPAPSADVWFDLGKKVTLSWEIEGDFDAVTLDPGAVVLAKDGSQPKGTLDLEPDAQPPADDGTYTLTASFKGAKSAPATLRARGIVGLRALADPNAQPAPTLSIDGGTVFQVDGKAGSFRQLPPNGAGWFGEVTPRGKMLVEWRVVGSAKAKVVLATGISDTNAEAAHKTEDVSARTRAADSFGRTGQASAPLEIASLPAIDAELRLFPDDAGASDPPKVTAVVRIRNGFPWPTIEDVHALDGTKDSQGDPLKWEDLSYSWKLAHVGPHKLVVTYKSGDKTLEPTETWYAGSGSPSGTVKPKIPRVEGKLTAEARLLNVKDQLVPGTAAIRIVTVTISPEAKPEPEPVDPPDEDFAGWAVNVAQHGIANHPPKVDESGAEFFVDGPSTFARMEKDLAAARDVIFMVGFESGSSTTMGGSTLGSLLQGAAARGVKVRGIFNGDGIRRLLNLGPKDNSEVVNLINALPGGLGVAFLDDHCGTTGAHHQKILAMLVGDRVVAYCGGVDIHPARADKAGWHDVHCRLEGPAAADLYNTCVERFQDNQTTFLKPLESFSTPPRDPPGVFSVQICRTYRDLLTPAAAAGNDQENGTTYAPLGEKGTIQLVLNAISRTREFIYLEDQFFVCDDDKLITALQTCIRQPTFKAFIATIARDSSVRSTLVNQSNRRRLKVIDALKSAGADKVIMCQPKQYYCHAKTWVFDDKFCIIGSANFNNRGYFSDSEVVAGIAHHNPLGKELRFAHRLRLALWEKHLGRTRKEVLAVDPTSIAFFRDTTNPGIEPLVENPDDDTSDSLTKWLIADPK